MGGAAASSAARRGPGSRDRLYLHSRAAFKQIGNKEHEQHESARQDALARCGGDSYLLPMREWKEEEAVPPHWTVSVDDERIVEIFAAHTARSEEVVRWDEISAWSRDEGTKRMLPAIVFLTTTSPFYKASVTAKASGIDVLLAALARRQVPEISLAKLREQVEWRQRAKVEEVLERRFSPVERSAVRAAFASNPEFASPYVQLATLNLAGSDVERIRRTTAGTISDWTEFLHAADQKGWGGL